MFVSVIEIIIVYINIRLFYDLGLVEIGLSGVIY